MVQNLIYNLCESFVKNIDGIASITKNTPPQEEILAPVTFEVTLNYADEYYWATFYTSMANYQAPDGVRVYKVNLNVNYRSANQIIDISEDFIKFQRAIGAKQDKAIGARDLDRDTYT